MSYLVFTSKEPSVVLGAAVGDFVGNGGCYVVLNRLTRLSVFRVDSTPTVHIGEFPVNGSIKYLRKVTIRDAERRVCQDVLFLFTIKQEVALVSFVLTESKEVSLRTLYSSSFDSHYQHCPGEVTMCTSTEESDPLVVFAVAHGKLVFFDVVAALGISLSSLSNGKLSSTKSAISKISVTAKTLHPSIVHYLSRVGVSKEPFSTAILDHGELDVRDIAFSRDSFGHGQTKFLVLSSDRHGKTHLSGYNVNTKNPPKDAHVPFFVLESGNSLLVNCLTGRCVLQSNMESSASTVISSPSGTFVVGSRLVSLIRFFGPRKIVCTKEIEASFGDIVGSCLFGDSALLLSLSSGHFFTVSVGDPEGTGYLEDEALSLRPLGEVPLAVPPDTLVSLTENSCLALSRFGDANLVHTARRSFECLVKNCGPVLDMISVPDDPYSNVVASTGVGRCGGLRVLRSAVCLEKEKKSSFSDRIRNVHSFGNLVVLECHGGNIFSQFRESEDQLVELESEEGLHGRILTMFGQGETFGVVFNTKIVTLRTDFNSVRMGGCITTTTTTAPFLLAHSLDTLIIAGTEKELFLYNGCEEYHRWVVSRSVSALCVVGPNTVAYADWGGFLTLFSVQSRSPLFSTNLHCVASSLCYTTDKLFIGTTDGGVIEAVLEGDGIREVRRADITKGPVTLKGLPNSPSLLCCGETAFVIIPDRRHSFDLTGFGISHVVGCTGVGTEKGRVLVVNRLDNSLHIGQLEANATFNVLDCPIQSTVTLVQNIPSWNGILFTARLKQKDVLYFIPVSDIGTLSVWRDTSKGVSFLENERCVFLQPFSFTATPNEDWTAEEIRDNSSDVVCLVGTSFTFADEPHARSSRISWYNFTTEGDGQSCLHFVGDQSINGALYCCAVVPGVPRKIVLGVSGCINCYTYDPKEEVFVLDDVCRMGMTIVKLIPGFHCQGSTGPVIFALDARYSAVVVTVDPVEGTTTVLRRSSKLRRLVDGVPTSDGSIWVSDDSLNIALLKSSGEEQGRKGRLQEFAEFHVGDLVTNVLRGSFAPLFKEEEDVVRVPLLSCVMKCINGSPLIFGTAYGSFGSIIPFERLLFLFCYALEKSLEDVEQLLPNRVFSHSSYRSSLAVGAPTAAALAGGGPSLKRLHDAFVEVDPKNVCDGTYVETFCHLDLSVQQKVLENAERYIVLWLLSEKEGFRNKLNGPTGSLDEDALVQCNKLLEACALPRLPLAADEVSDYIYNLRRIH